MPALKDIHERIESDPIWAEQYKNSVEQARGVADRLPLVHVTAAGSFLELMSEGDQQLMPSQSGRRSQTTRESEESIGWEPCIYFYAGRAWPEFGEIALAYSGECEDGQEGSATPFDSGGLITKRIYWDESDYSHETVRSFINDSIIKLSEWRKTFAIYLAAYFYPLSDYWVGRPCMKDPEGIFMNEKNNWRAWVFEIRFHQRHNICSQGAWAFSEAVSERLREMIDDEPPVDAFETPLDRFMKDRVLLTPEGDPDFWDIMEVWIRTTTLEPILNGVYNLP